MDNKDELITQANRVIKAMQGDIRTLTLMISTANANDPETLERLESELNDIAENVYK